MIEQQVLRVAELASSAILSDYGHRLAVSEIVEFLRAVLGEPRNLIECERLGIVTADEVVSAVVDRLEDWATHRLGLPGRVSLGRLMEEVKGVLFG
jgi:hypothetical protein